MMRLGFWQHHKAEQKLALQKAYDARLNDDPVAVPTKVDNIENWRYRRLRGQGYYDTTYQILLDNQVENGIAGYHVITPFRAEGSDALMLVDRGWIPVGDRSKMPEIDTPATLQEVVGFAWVPSTKFYQLMTPAESSEWQLLWQNMDMARYQKMLPYPVLPFVLRLDKSSEAGFIRNWVMPAERVEKHIGYAWQWWGFSFTLIVIWVVVNIKKEES